MTAERIATVLEARRSGTGWMARCVAHEDRSPSLSIRQEGETVLVHCFAGCRQADVIEALRARGLWPEPERPERTPAERADWGRQQRELERVLPDARYWRRAAIAMAGEWLVNAKARLFDPLPASADLSERVELRGTGIYDAEQMLSRLRVLDGAELVQRYSDWRREHPGWAVSMVRAAREREQMESAATVAFLKELEAAG